MGHAESRITAVDPFAGQGKGKQKRVITEMLVVMIGNKGLMTSRKQRSVATHSMHINCWTYHVLSFCATAS